ncbi:MAG: hypothetical protein JO193_04960 [Candidatus Eremiobacteraeota bacterium]|nr:hypothetical protein [Candidatus Eremiobacteraeota bacterium]
MPFRKFLAALALGLPAALAAHFLTFGDAHPAGGAAHLLFIDAMVATVCASVLALCVGAIYIAAATREGSIVAASLDRLMPSALMLAATATAWFVLIERAEGSHALPLGWAAVAVICVALLLRFALGGILRLLAAAALRWFTVCYRSREFDRFESLVRPLPTWKRLQLALSHFSRPPPHFA